MAAEAASSQRYPQGSTGRQRRRDTRHHLGSDARRRQSIQLLLRPTEQHRIATLEPHHTGVASCRIHQPLVDERLRRGMACAALAHLHQFGLAGQGQCLRMDQSVVQHDVGLLQQSQCTQGQQVRRSRTRAHQKHPTVIHRCHHCKPTTMPAASV